MKNILLASSSILVTLFLSLLVIRWLAPGLLGLPVDLQLVQVDKKVPPFYEGVFRKQDLVERRFIVQDPFTKVRARPFFPDATYVGPNDLLGFRNRTLPMVADIVTIGDSQTYGNNALLDDNWPQQMVQHLSIPVNHYSMATGGWAAPQYLNMINKAGLFKPRVIIVALYTGNDPLESFMLTYGSPHWAFLIPDKNLSLDDVPEFKWAWPPSENDLIKVTFSDGLKMAFTPGVRLKSNIDHPVVHAGYQIMKDVVARITAEATGLGIQPVFTIIPTKEFAYSKKIKQENIEVSEDYQLLVQRESENIENLQQVIESNEGAVYVDVVTSLQEVALNSRPLYSDNSNGHPRAYGYEVIGREVAAKVEEMIPNISDGFVGVQTSDNEIKTYLLRDGVAYLFPNKGLIAENGWERPDGQFITQRDVAKYQQKLVETVDKEKYGPR